MESAKLWYEMLVDTLVNKLNFVINAYDSCVANCMIDGHQCTICWYVDDLKISHINPEVVKNVIKQIESVYGKMTISTGTTHVYVGININYGNNQEAYIDMIDHVQEAIDDFPEKCSSKVNSPAGAHLFEINDHATLIPESDRKIFHKIVSKLLFISNRARPDIVVPISFLTSRVTKATTDDWKKLQRVLCYLQNTITMKLTISIDNTSVVKTWVDASYACHHDMRSHTGGTILMGKGVLYTRSTKQKLNTKSSTEAELVGASDFLSQTMWTKRFLEAQGYNVSKNEFFQDNMSAMHMEENGRSSAGQKSRHINIRYFFIKDRIESGDILLLHCPTERMIADFFTKPLQGKLFFKFRDVIMGITHHQSLNQPTLPTQICDHIPTTKSAHKIPKVVLVPKKNKSVLKTVHFCEKLTYN